ncbi:MAG: type III pantothenate kinase [Planctomycetota bacterium]
MILAFDIGNGSIKLARFADGRREGGLRLPLDADLAPYAAEEVVAAVSVNPAALARAKAALPRLRVVGQGVPYPLPVLYDPPGSLGADRVMGVVGALHQLPDAPAVAVLDVGTCLTVTVGLRGQGVLGGAILPGAALMGRALRRGTAALPDVAVVFPDRAVGRSTEESIRSGIGFGLVGAARELLRRTLEECPAGTRVVAAGTGADALAGHLSGIDAVHPFATLWGVYVAVTSASRRQGGLRSGPEAG